MLDFLRDKVSERKLRLLAVAICRRLQHWLWDWKSVETAENYAEGLVGQHDLMSVRTTALGHAGTLYRHLDRQEVEVGSALIEAATATHAAEAALHAVQTAVAIKEEIPCDLLRDLFGNPFRSVTLSPSCFLWNDAAVVRLAQTAYEQRILPAGTLDNARLLILADALEEAGCTDEQILTHLRGGDEHYRGCWVLDCLLGKQ